MGNSPSVFRDEYCILQRSNSLICASGQPPSAGLPPYIPTRYRRSFLVFSEAIKLQFIFSPGVAITLHTAKAHSVRLLAGYVLVRNVLPPAFDATRLSLSLTHRTPTER